MLCNVIALLLFVANIWMIKERWDDANPAPGSVILLTGAGFILTLVAGFFRMDIGTKHHVGVDPLPDSERVRA